MAPQLFTLSPIRSRGTSPYTTAPSSPKLLGYFSDDDSDFEFADSVSSFVPFNWEEKPGKPKTFAAGDEIAFEFQVDRLHNSLTLPAEDLFAGGKFKPLKPPPAARIIADPFEAAIASARNGQIETPSFAASSKLKRLRNLLLFRRFTEPDKAGLFSTGSGSTSTSGSANEPDIGYEVGGRSLPLCLCRPHFFRCFRY